MAEGISLQGLRYILQRIVLFAVLGVALFIISCKSLDMRAQQLACAPAVC